MDVVRVIAVLQPGGAQLSALRLDRALRDRGVTTVRFLAGSADADGLALARRHGVEVQAFATGLDGLRADLQWTLSPAFVAWLAERLTGAQVVHAHMVGAWWAAARALRTTGSAIPLVASEHNAVGWPRGDSTAGAADAALRVGAFFAHGSAARQFALRIGVPASRLHEGRSVIEGMTAEPLPGLAVPRITATGRLAADKGSDVLLDALAAWVDAPPAHLVGTGPLLPSLKARVRAEGLGSRVHLPGWRDDAARFVAGSAVHVVPSREDALPQSALLGLGLGVPVVGSAVGGLVEVLGGGRGRLVPPAHPSALRAALSAVLAGDRPDPRPGREYAAEHSAVRAVEPYAECYDALVGHA